MIMRISVGKLTDNERLVGHLLDEALALGLFDVKVERVDETRLHEAHKGQEDS